MELRLVRKPSQDGATLGDLFLDGEWLCHTLEDEVRDEKVPGRTAIPAGRYALTITYSPRFKVVLPLLLKVPGFEGIRIHAGNTPEDTEGCILVGKTVVGPAALGQSRAALGDLIDKLRLPAWITIEGAV